MSRAWYQPQAPNEPVRPVPWLCMAAREYLDNLVQPDWRIAEHGGGGSTVWFASKCKHVTTVERNQAWLNKLVEKRLPNATLIYGRDVPNLEEQQIDLLLIDGEPLEDRIEWMEAAARLVKPGGWVVLDNANWDMFNGAKQELLKVADLVETIDGNEGSTQHLVTEFYRMRPLQVDMPVDYGATMQEAKKKRRKKVK